jgi:hypothetical protein
VELDLGTAPQTLIASVKMQDKTQFETGTAPQALIASVKMQDKTQQLEPVSEDFIQTLWDETEPCVHWPSPTDA